MTLLRHLLWAVKKATTLSKESKIGWKLQKPLYFQQCWVLQEPVSRWRLFGFHWTSLKKEFWWKEIQIPRFPLISVCTGLFYQSFCEPRCQMQPCYSCAAPHAYITLEHVGSGRSQCKLLLALLWETWTNTQVNYQVCCKVLHCSAKLKSYLPLFSPGLVPCEDNEYWQILEPSIPKCFLHAVFRCDC